MDQQSFLMFPCLHVVTCLRGWDRHPTHKSEKLTILPYRTLPAPSSDVLGSVTSAGGGIRWILIYLPNGGGGRSW